MTTVKEIIATNYGNIAYEGVLGSSFGGLISLYIAHQYQFDFAASMSAPLGWGSIDATTNNQTLIELYDSQTPATTKLYVDSGGSGLLPCLDSDQDGIQDDSQNSDNFCVNRQFYNTLLSSVSVQMNLLYGWDPNAPHNEVAWGARVRHALEFFYQN